MRRCFALQMDYDDEVLAMDSEEAEVLEEEGIEANIGTVEVQGESEIVDACVTCDCSRVVVCFFLSMADAVCRPLSERGIGRLAVFARSRPGPNTS